jgi:cobalamin biosynthesis Mg chelatase CobN
MDDMAANIPVSRVEIFDRYEAALAGLVQVPTRLNEELSTAQATQETALLKASVATKDEEQRLARLRQTITDRFAESSQSLRDAKMLVPQQVRPATGQKGDANSLTAAINAQSQAEQAVARELQAAVNAAKLQAAGDKSRAAAGLEAAEALRRRQEHVRKARQEAEAEAERKRLAEDQESKQRRQLILVGVLVALVVLVAVAVLLA